VRFHNTGFTCAFDLKKFPFDRQHLAVRVTTMWDERRVQFLKSETEPVRSITEDSNLQDYRLTTARIVDQNTPWQSDLLCPCRSDPGTSTSLCRYNSAYLIHTVQRYPGYYLFNLYLPTFLISTFALSVFAFTADQFDGRSNIIVTVLLTVVAFKQSIKQQVPILPYITYVDRYILAGLGLVVVVAIETAALSAASICVAEPSRKPTLCSSDVLGKVAYYGFVDTADQICWGVDVGAWLIYNIFEAFMIFGANRSSSLMEQPGAPNNKSSTTVTAVKTEAKAA